MELEIQESRGRISTYSYLSPTGISRKFVVPETAVRRCIEAQNISVTTAINVYNGQPERRVEAENILGIIDCITRTRRGVYPDLERRISRPTGLVVEVDPAQRPQNQTSVLHGRHYYTRTIIFTS